MPAVRGPELASAVANARARLDAMEAVVAAADGDVVTFNLAAAGTHAVTISRNRVLAVANPRVGQVFRVAIRQDAIGGRTVTWWPGLSWPSGTAPTLTTAANKIDVFEFVCTAADVYLGRTFGLNYT